MIAINIRFLHKRDWWMRFLRIHQEYAMPASWNEMTREQLIKVCAIMFGQGEEYLSRLKMAHALSNIPFITYAFMSNTDKWFLYENCKWVSEFDKVDLTKQQLLVIGKLRGPDAELKNIRVREFIFADTFYHRYLADRNPADLITLCAILYRPKRDDGIENGDIRDAFNNSTIEKRFSIVKKWKPGYQHAVFIFYHGCRMKIVNDNPDLFKSGDGSNDFGLYPIVSDLAPKFGSMEAAYNALLSEFMIEWKYSLSHKQK